MATTKQMIANTSQLVQDYLRDTDFLIEPQSLNKRDIKKLVVRVNKNIDEKRLKGMIHHNLSDIVIIVFLATMCGCESWTDFEDFGESHEHWLRSLLKLPYGIPSHDTFERVFSMVDSTQLERATSSFVIDCLTTIKNRIEQRIPEGTEVYQQYSVDGKELRGSGRKHTASSDEKVRNLQLLHVYNCSEEYCMFTRAIDDKTNEIPAAQELLSTLNLNKTIVSFDAMNTQKETIKVIRQQKGEYIGGLKENQQLFYKEVKEAFDDATLKKYRKRKSRYLKTIDNAHSCIEVREYYMMDDLTWFAEIEKWDSLKSVVLCVSTKERKDGTKSNEYRFYISSLKNIEVVAQGIRGHWAVENKLHWQLDYTFREDEQTTTNREALTNLSVIKKMALEVMKLSRPFYGKLLHDNGPISLRRIKKLISYHTEQELANILSFISMKNVIEVLTK